MIRKFMSSCVQCMKYNEQKFKMELQPVYTNVCKDVHPFQQVSVDMLGKMDILPWPEARKTIEVYPLLVKCIATSAVVMTIMETAKTISVILGLLQVEVKLGIKFESISIDAGSNFLVSNLDPVLTGSALAMGNEGQRLFNLLGSHTSQRDSQWTNYSESSTSLVKASIRKMFYLTKHQKLPTLNREELNYIVNLICYEINSIPYEVTKSVKEFLLSPADLIYVSQRRTLIGQVESHLPDVTALCDKLTSYRDALNNILIETFQARLQRLRKGLNPKSKKSSTKESIDVADLVVLIRPKFQLVETASVVEVGKTQALLRFKDGGSEWHSIANLVPLTGKELKEAQIGAKEK